LNVTSEATELQFALILIALVQVESHQQNIKYSKSATAEKTLVQCLLYALCVHIKLFTVFSYLLFIFVSLFMFLCLEKEILQKKDFYDTS